MQGDENVQEDFEEQEATEDKTGQGSPDVELTEE